MRKRLKFIGVAVFALLVVGLVVSYLQPSETNELKDATEKIKNLPKP